MPQIKHRRTDSYYYHGKKIQSAITRFGRRHGDTDEQCTILSKLHTTCAEFRNMCEHDIKWSGCRRVIETLAECPGVHDDKSVRHAVIRGAARCPEYPVTAHLDLLHLFVRDGDGPSLCINDVYGIDRKDVFLALLELHQIPTFENMDNVITFLDARCSWRTDADIINAIIPTDCTPCSFNAGYNIYILQGHCARILWHVPLPPPPHTVRFIASLSYMCYTRRCGLESRIETLHARASMLKFLQQVEDPITVIGNCNPALVNILRPSTATFDTPESFWTCVVFMANVLPSRIDQWVVDQQHAADPGCEWIERMCVDYIFQIQIIYICVAHEVLYPCLQHLRLGDMNKLDRIHIFQCVKYRNAAAYCLSIWGDAVEYVRTLLNGDMFWGLSDTMFVYLCETYPNAVGTSFWGTKSKKRELMCVVRYGITSAPILDSLKGAHVTLSEYMVLNTLHDVPCSWYSNFDTRLFPQQLFLLE